MMKTLNLLFFVVAISMYSERIAATWREGLDDIPTWVGTVNSAEVLLCNDTHFCRTRNPPCADGPITDHLACYCDTLCLSFDDCCSDYEETCLTDYETFTTITTDEPQADPHNETDLLGKPLESYECNTLSYAAANMKLGFWVVAKCSKVRDPMCEDALRPPPPDITDENFMKMYIPVTSIETGLAYKNEYCAACNEDYGERVHWSLRIEDRINASKYRDDLSLENKFYLYVVSYKSVTWFPPTVTKVIRTCIMFEDSECEGDESYNSAEVELCNTITAYVRKIGMRIDNEVYQKSICLECSENSGYDVICTRKIPTAVHLQNQKEMNMDEFHLLPISVIIDFTGSSQIVHEKEGYREVGITCPNGHVFDPLTRECIPLSCSEGLFMDIDACVHDLESNQDCPKHVQEWSLEFHPDAHRSCEGKLNIMFECLRQEGIHVALVKIISSYRAQLHCYYNVLVDASSLPNITSNWTSLDEFMIRMMATPKSQFYDQCVILKAELFMSCKSVLEERCVGPLNSFPLHLIQHSPTGNKYYFVDETSHWYPENMAVGRITYDEDGRKFMTVSVCDESILLCQFVILNRSLFSDIRNKTGEIEYKPTSRMLPPGQFKVIDNEHVQVCNFFNITGLLNTTSITISISFSLNQSIVSTVGCCLSLVALFMTFLTYARFRALRRCVCNKLIMCLCATLFIGQLFLLLGGLANFNPILCTAVSSFSHYTWLVAFALTFSLAYDLNRTFGSETVNRNNENNPKVVLFYISNSFGTPLLVVIPCLIIQTHKGENVIYGRNGICWLSDQIPMLLSFGIPVAITLCLNMVLFTHTVVAIVKTKRLSRKLLLHHLRKPTYAENMKELLIYFKISTLMGFTWVVGFIAAYINSQVVWYIFVVLNSLQGAFIFLAFMCNKRVWRLWVQGRPTKTTSTSDRKSSNGCPEPSGNEMPFPNSRQKANGSVKTLETNRDDAITKM